MLLKQIMITAQHLPGCLNVEADYESRNVKDSSEWKLNRTIFQKLCNRPFCIQSVKTTSPLHVMENRSIQSWKGCFSDSLGRQDFNYAFPPIYLIGRVLAKVQRDRASIMLIIPA